MSIINHQRVLITGAAGFVGSYLARKLVNYSTQVRGIDSLIRGKIVNVQPLLQYKNYSFTRGNILNKGLMQKKTRDIDVIFHEAALIDVNESMQKPSLYEKNNVFGTYNVLEAARINDVKCFILLPITENASLMPLSPYAKTKIEGEKLCQKYYEDYGISTVILRYFNIYGPGQIPSSYSGVITRFFDNALNDEPLTIFGDGNQTRDFIYIDDVGQANILAAKENKVEGETINVGSGRKVAINDLAKTVLDIMGKTNLRIIHEPPRTGDITHSQASIKKGKSILGFKPQYDLQSGLKETIIRLAS